MGETAALVAAACWATASVLWARLGAAYDVVALNLLKCLLAAVGLALTLLILEGTAWPTGLSATDLGWLALSGVAGLTIGDSAYFGALTRIGARRTLLIWALAPGLSAAMAWPMLDEPIDGPMLLGMTVTTAGVVWVMNERVRTRDDEALAQPGSRRFWVGLALAAGSLLCQASSNVFQKVGGLETDALSVSVVRLSVGAAGLGLWMGGAGALAKAVAPLKDARTTATIVFATAIGTYLGIWLSAYGLLHADVGVAATLNATSPIFVLPLAVVVAKERVSGRAVGGALVAVAGVAVFFLT